MEREPKFGSVPLERFVAALATEEPVPGGGSAAAVAGALGAALVVMVARLTRGRERYAEHEATAAEVELAADRLRLELLELADRDAAAYGRFVAARRLPRGSEAERERRRATMHEAAREAVRVPLRVAAATTAVLSLAHRLAEGSNPNAVSDVGAAALFAGAALRAAALNVRINLPALEKDDPLAREAREALARLLTSGSEAERSAHRLVEAALG